MEKKTELWSVSDLAGAFTSINFPEYQREPNVWARVEKQRLVDSMVRQFDIASLYLYIDPDGLIDCIDGRQRIGAIMSFIGQNPQDVDNGFEFRILNEIYSDEGHVFESLHGQSFSALEKREDNPAQQFVSDFRAYKLTVVQLAGTRQPEEFNLQFTRLNLGTIINSGEKLHAMVGDLRNVCFLDLGEHPFFDRTGMPTRRYGKEQTVAQLIVQILSFVKTGTFTRTRHFDLQRAFKEFKDMNAEEMGVVERVRDLLDRLSEPFASLVTLKNRAMTVSAVLLAFELNTATQAEARELAEFLNGFLCRLQWQVKKGLDVDQEYRYLIDFQRHLTQASVEKPAVIERVRVLRQEFERWRTQANYTGDTQFRMKNKADPDEECRR